MPIFKEKYKYPNLAAFFSVTVLTYLFYRAGILQQWVEALEKLSYFGVLLTGVFFVSTFTVIPATAVLFLLAGKFGVVVVSLVSGIGAVIGDYAIFRFVKDGLVGELKNIFQRAGGEAFFNAHWMAHTKYFGWFGPMLGAIIIASPLPDELGIGLLGIYKLDNKKFILLSFILNSVGIFLLLSAIKIF